MSGKGSAMQNPAAESTAARQKQRRRGGALIELTLLSPWVFFLFIGIVDLGFFSYALISVENAARIGAEYTSANTTTVADQAGACTKVLAELANLPNVAGLSSCSATPLTVTAAAVTGPDGKPATSVSISYQSISLIPIPGLLQSQLNVTRNVQMRVRPW
jgi:Flp pilus assembly protein TadG